MQVFVVGGAVRDALMGQRVNDRDWVVVGSTPEAMVAAGYTPVGRDFPVFLHPRTQEEYALARTERKTAPGYAGFVFHAATDVTLEEDLARRDLHAGIARIVYASLVLLATGTAVWAVAAAVSTAACVYHGYKRNDSVGFGEDQVWFRAKVRTDSDLIDSSAINVLHQAVT